MRTSKEMAILRARIVQLRREGRSRRQIKEILGTMSNSTLDDALKGEPPPEWTRRARAKDNLREHARELRAQGLDLQEIAAAPRRGQELGLAVGPRPSPSGPPQLRGMQEASG
jgi:DNA-binding transcriptional MerR regulator